MNSPIKTTLGLAFLGILFVATGLIFYFQRYPLKVDPDIGTILVYEIADEDLPAVYGPDTIAEALRSRVDPSGYANISVRPLNNHQLEVRIPRRENHEDRVEDIKELVAHSGVFEFRILANEVDDREAIEVARRYFADAKNDPAIRAELEERNGAGQAPTPPVAPTKAGFETEKGLYQYEWLQVGRRYQMEMDLDDAAENERDASGDRTLRGLIWQSAAEARQNNELIERMDRPGRPFLFSRAVSSARVGGDFKGKKYEYFLLARKTEEGRENPGTYIESANVSHLFSSVHFSVNQRGSDLIGELTEKSINRQMASVLGGRIISSANVQSKITTDGQITGRFTEEDLERLAALLRLGTSAALVKPKPVNEKPIKR